MMIDRIKKDIKEIIIQSYRINSNLFTDYTNVFSYPIYLKARDILYIIYALSQKYNLFLESDMNNYENVSVNSLADYLNSCKLK
jgi:hypothetical protein